MAKEVEEFNQEKVKRRKDDVDTLLVFAILFSTVLIVLGCSSSKLSAFSNGCDDLHPRAYRQSDSQYNFADGKLVASDLSAPRSAFHASNDDIRVNVLWFASLVELKEREERNRSSRLLADNSPNSQATGAKVVEQDLNRTGADPDPRLQVDGLDSTLSMTSLCRMTSRARRTLQKMCQRADQMMKGMKERIATRMKNLEEGKAREDVEYGTSAPALFARTFLTCHTIRSSRGRSPSSG
ncbi:hypothetical protein BDY19DRAFT_1049821 [Irpex rosettiformis]|uniref:Uncharacterized protein n=1 Tax=Irpex rosettiformis TaxID=378272 RepID=A0ACB8TXA4_9APHY|nr:hypothetical protein BDY19DRAFT_1049821 [Irpex rosettiformis]